jgi:hypothetical protein
MQCVDLLEQESAVPISELVTHLSGTTECKHETFSFQPRKEQALPEVPTPIFSK